jgi:hypothetical protein
MKHHLLVVLAAVAGFIVYGLAVDSKWIWVYAPISLFFAGVVALFHRRVGFSQGLLLALALVIVGNLAGGVLEVNGEILYLKHVVGGLQYDKVFHATATGVASWASWQVVGGWGLSRGRFLVALMMGAGGGAFVEIFEFVGTKLLDTNVGGYDNNMQDLIANTTGSLVALLIARFWRTGNEVRSH